MRLQRRRMGGEEPKASEFPLEHCLFLVFLEGNLLYVQIRESVELTYLPSNNYIIRRKRRTFEKVELFFGVFLAAFVCSQ